MHALIVTAHPNRDSYTRAVVDQFSKGFTETPDNTFEVLNLSDENFDPRFGGHDMDVFHGRGKLASEITAEHDRIARADVLVLIFPVYWWSMPALLKGWIDRVFVSGWAFEESPEEELTRLLDWLHGKVIAIGGADAHTYEKRGYLDAMNKQIVEGIFDYCGMKTLRTDLLSSLDADKGLQVALASGRAVSNQMSA